VGIFEAAVTGDAGDAIIATTITAIFYQ